MSFKIPRAKYNNKTAFAGDKKFASIMERDFFLILMKRKAAGKIKHIECQPKIRLSKAGILFVPDFLVTLPDDSLVYYEVKGCKTPVYNLKIKLFLSYIDTPIIEVKKERGQWTETSLGKSKAIH